MTFFQWAKKHASNLNKIFDEKTFESPYDLNTKIEFPPNADQLHFVMLVNKHIQNSRQ